jgi:transposase-like protein
VLLVLPRKTITEPGAHPRQVNAYDKFMAGFDTQQIADIYSVKERTALRWISNERSRRHEISSPYEAQA